MSNLCLLFIFSISLIGADIIWTVSKFSFDDEPKICACYCSDESMSFAEFSSKVKYKGLTRNESSCTCEDFLAPKLHRYILANANDTCEICKCEVEEDAYCKDGEPTFYAKYQTITATVLFVTIGLAVMNALFSCCAQKNRGYERIINYTEVTESPHSITMGKLDFTKPIAKLQNVNNGIKLKYKQFEDKIRKGKTGGYAEI